jgi:hypothetical protein
LEENERISCLRDYFSSVEKEKKWENEKEHNMAVEIINMKWKKNLK